MPAKGKRVASRQAQLNRRRRRQARVGADGGTEAVDRGDGASTTIVAPPAPVSAAAVADSGANEYEPTPAAASSGLAARSGGSPNATRVQTQSRIDRSMAYTHLGAELRRILILAGILTAVLLLVSFVVPPFI